MPDKQFDFWIWLWAILTGPDVRAAFWAGVGGMMRTYTMHRDGGRVSLVDFLGTMLMAIGWGTALAPVAGHGVALLFERAFGWVLPLGVDLMPAAIITIGLSAAALTMAVIDFATELRHRIRSRGEE